MFNKRFIFTALALSAALVMAGCSQEQPGSEAQVGAAEAPESKPDTQAMSPSASEIQKTATEAGSQKEEVVESTQEEGTTQQ